MPLISVIVPVYKVEKYLDRCLTSIVEQTFSDFELILVDDGSPDQCPEMCENWKVKDQRIRVIHQKNQGLSAARNAGIRIAKGDYLTFIDSDDWVMPTMLGDLLSLIKKYDADISVCGFIATDRAIKGISNNKDCKETVYSQREFMNVILRVNSNRCIHYAWGKLYKRSVIDMKNHYPIGMLNEDVEGMFKAVIASKRIVETTKIGYFYYENNESISRKKFGANFLCLHEVWRRILRLSKESAPLYYEYVKYNYQRSDFTILMDMILYGDKETDKKYASERVRINKRLRNNVNDLLKSPMQKNRKIMLLLVAYAYMPSKNIIRTCHTNLVRKLRRNGNRK